MPIPDNQLQAVADTAKIVAALKRLNDAPDSVTGQQVDIRFLEEAADEELISGKLAPAGKAIAAVVPGLLRTGFVSDFSNNIKILAAVLEEALARFDGVDPATWSVRRMIDMEPENTNPDYRNRFFELSHCLLTGELESGLITMPVRSTKTDCHSMHHPLGAGRAIGFEYRKGSDQTVTPISWGEGLRRGETNQYRWPCGGPANLDPRPPDDQVVLAQIAAQARADEPLRIPVWLPDGVACRISVFVGNPWDPRPAHRGDNAGPAGLFTFDTEID